MDRNNQVTTAQLLTNTVKGINTIKNAKPAGKNQLVDDIKRAVEELNNIRRYFEIVDEPELIDYAIYREKAALMKLSYLLKQAKKDEPLKCSQHI